MIRKRGVNGQLLPEPSANRFWEKVEVRDIAGCWVWVGAISDTGYGSFQAEGSSNAHRYSYANIRGHIPAGLHIDHLCRNRRCVNPAHLEPVTCKENVLRGQSSSAIYAQRTHCSAGHRLDEQNVYEVRRDGTIVGRRCRTCHRERRPAATRTGPRPAAWKRRSGDEGAVV